MSHSNYFHSLSLQGHIATLRQELEEQRRREMVRLFQNRRAERSVEDFRADFDALSDQVAEMALVLQSLTRYLDEKGEINAQRFMEIMTEIDADDGEVDGKLSKPKRKVPKVSLPKARRR